MNAHLVAVAWPYANGPLHVGHVAGSLLPPDVYARYLRLRGRNVLMVSGSDMHGTPITVAAEKEGIAPTELAERNRRLHVEAIEALGIHFDLFTSTATKNHEEVVQDVFVTLLRNGYIEKRAMISPYDPQAARFLPDRYVEGECPNCHAKDARGDQCDHCGRTLDPQDLIDPRSKLTGVAPEFRSTDHFFLMLTKLEAKLLEWVRTQSKAGAWRPAVTSFTENWIKEGLKDRAITRDLTYGIPIPKEAGEFPDKRIYVWFDAVIGYLSAAQEASKKGLCAWEDFWKADQSPKQAYFLGKDNIPFHTIILPAILLGYNDKKSPGDLLAMPWDVAANQFLQFSGAKFSKSRGNAFYVLDLLKTFDVDSVRYYITSNLPERSDCDWTWHDFIAKTNEEFLATVGNYFNRVLAFCEKTFGRAPSPLPDDFDATKLTPKDPVALIVERNTAFKSAAEDLLVSAAEALEARELKKAFRALVTLAQHGNKAVDELAPWSLIKLGDDGKAFAGSMLLTHLAVIKSMAVAYAPFLPHLSASLWGQLGESGLDPKKASEHSDGSDHWPSTLLPFTPGQAFGKIGPIVRKLDRDEILKEFSDAPDGAKTEEAPKEKQKKPEGKKSVDSKKAETAPPTTIGIEDFTKIDLRIGLVTKVENHPNGDKLFVLQVDLGTETRQICAGLRGSVAPEDLLGKRVTVVTNLAPRVLRGVESNGMLLAATDGDKKALVTSSFDVAPGSKIG